MSNINHAMERLGRIVAADQGLDVECRGMMAFAGPGRIVIPSLENLDHLGPDGERMMHGYLDHECAHASDTDFALFKYAAENDGPAFKDLFNAVEDGYIEGRQGNRFRGSRYNLAQKNTWFWERQDEEGETCQTQMKDPEIDPWRKFTMALTLCTRPHGGRAVADFRGLDQDTFDRLMLVEDEMDEVRALYETPRATKACYDIAKRIYQKFDTDSPPPTNADGSEGDKAPEDLQLELSKWDAEAIEVMKMLKDPESAINKALQAVLGGTDLGKDCDFDGKIQPPKDDPGFDNEVPRGTRPYIIFSREYDHVHDFTGDVRVSGKYDTLVSETREQADALIFAFEAALRSRMETAPTYGHDEGHMDVEALVEFSVGSRSADTLYIQNTGEVDADDVAVSIVVDCSGSMGSYERSGSKSHLAAQTATALHRACASCDLAHEVLGFTTTFSSERWEDAEEWEGWVAKAEKSELARKHLLEAQQKGQDVSQFARIYNGGDLTVPFGASLMFPAHAIFKRFGTHDGRGISHIDGISGNLDGEAVIWAARRLAERPEKRRVMFVLSDGYPAGAGGGADEHGYLKESVARCIKAGIEVYGIGIKSEAVSNFYPTYWVANRLEDLTDLAMGALMDVLGLNRQEHACVTL